MPAIIAYTDEIEEMHTENLELRLISDLVVVPIHFEPVSKIWWLDFLFALCDSK